MEFNLIPAALADYPVLQNIARFYVYDLSRECGKNSSQWAIPHDGLYESFDFKNYFEDSTRKAFIVKVSDELAGFVLLNQACLLKNSEWNMGEFFILARFQKTGLGGQVAKKVWQMHPGRWEVSVIPENKTAIGFWRKIIKDYTRDNFVQEVKTVTFDIEQASRVLFSFES